MVNDCTVYKYNFEVDCEIFLQLELVNIVYPKSPIVLWCA